jgi:hypothetical protein
MEQIGWLFLDSNGTQQGPVPQKDIVSLISENILDASSFGE